MTREELNGLCHITRNSLLVIWKLVDKGEYEKAKHRCKTAMNELDELLRKKDESKSSNKG